MAKDAGPLAACRHAPTPFLAVLRGRTHGAPRYCWSLSGARRNDLRAVQTAAENAGLVAEGQQPVGLHDLRHSLAANAFAVGLNAVEVSRLLRHATAQVTMTVYAGLTDDAATTRSEPSSPSSAAREVC